MFRKSLFLSATAALALALAACSADSSSTISETTPSTEAVSTETSAVEQAAMVSVSDAWARSVPGKDGMNMGAIYGVFASTVDDAIVSASVEPATVANMVEIHEVVTNDSGEMEMRQVERVSLPAGIPVELKPGSFHIMLKDMPEVLPVGYEFKVTVQFAKSDPLTFGVVVREDTGMSSDMSSDMSNSKEG